MMTMVVIVIKVAMMMATMMRTLMMTMMMTMMMTLMTITMTMMMTRLQRWSFFGGDAMLMFFSSSDAMSMVLATSYHRNRCDYF